MGTEICLMTGRQRYGDRLRLIAAVITAASLTLTVGSRNQAIAQTANASGSPDTIDEVIVTARKKSESIIEVPGSITEFGAATLANYNIQEFNDYATKIPNLSFTAGSSGAGVTTAQQVAIRGISGNNTTSFYIDDTPVPDSLDPRLVGIDRIEVLKGPQGTLFGENSLGGEVRFITDQPEFAGDSLAFMAQGGWTEYGGSPDYGANIDINHVVVPGEISIRASVFEDHDAGFITRTYPSANGTGRDSSSDQGAITFYGGSLAALFTVSDRLSVTGREIFQSKADDGLPIAYAPLPAFEPTYTENRAADVPEGASDRWSLSSIDVDFSGNGFKLTSSTSFFYRQTLDTDDGTEATSQLMASIGFNPTPADVYQWHQSSATSQFTEEARVAFDPFHNLSGVVGLYYSHSLLSGGLPAEFAPGLEASGFYPTNELYGENVDFTNEDEALFGELYYQLLDQLSLTVGGRVYYLKQTSDEVGNGFFNGGLSNTGVLAVHETGAIPKVALSYTPNKESNIYVLYSEGFRPGGPNQLLPSACDADLAALGLTPQSVSLYKPDSTRNYEAGAKTGLFSDRAYLSGAVYQIDWVNVQQSISLPDCGFHITGNSGAARSRGAEVELNGQVLTGLDVRLGVGYDEAVITEEGDTPQTVGSRVFGAPKFTGTAGFRYTVKNSGQYAPFFSGDYSYVGNSLSANFSPSEPLLRPAYMLTNVRVGVAFAHSELSLFVNNVFNEKANLGDIVPISFEQTVPAPGGGVEPLVRVGLLNPLTIGLQYRYGFK